MERIYIYGPPGSGKSTLGKRLAEGLQLPFYDLDEIIVANAGLSIPDIFSQKGETGFRIHERRALEQVLDIQKGVTALGGGALLDSENRSLVESAGLVLCLNASFESLLMRSNAQDGERPLLIGDTAQRLLSLLTQRAEHYASFSRRLDTEVLSLEQAVWEAQIALGRFHVLGMGQGYDVQVIPGGIAKLGQALSNRGMYGPVGLVSDSNVAPLHASTARTSLEQAGYQVADIVFPAGEAHKHIQTTMNLWEGFINAGLERISTVVALGGGVVGDITGFAAATYLRGVNWVVVPTSLLAMVDASLGGKTGVDVPQGKNLVGAFHPPSLVLADPETLSTLPEDEQRNGLAEVVKHGILADPVLFDMCRQGLNYLQSDWDAVVRRAMAVKVRVIVEDPYEKARRASLNLGHTLGHAIELSSGFKLKHGEAVAIGMVAAAKLAKKLGMANEDFLREIVTVLERLGLPTEIPAGMDTQQILETMKRDKKRAKGGARLVLPIDIGEVRWGVERSDVELIQVMAPGENFG